MWTGNGCEKQYMGGSGLKLSMSGLNMRGSGWEWMGVDKSGWNGVRPRFSTKKIKKLKSPGA